MTDAEHRQTSSRIAGALRAPAHRDAVVGVRQLRHPVQGVRRRRACRATRTRRSPTRRRCTASPAWRRRVALHIPWDRVDDYAELAAARRPSWACALGTINTNVFQDDDYKLGSVTNPDPAVRRKAIDHLLECVDIMDATGSRDLKLWFSDGTNYPGQDDIAGPAGPARRRRCAEVYARLGADQRMLLEYKLFEPAFYTTDVPDWGTAYAHCLRSATGRRSCIDTGHHAPGTNIEFIVAVLLRAGKLGGVRLQLPLLRRRRPDGRRGRPVPAVPDHVRDGARRRLRPDERDRVHARPVPQHRAEDPRPDPLGDERAGGDAPRRCWSTATRCATAQDAGDVLGANAVLMDAYNTDVRPLLRRAARGAWASTPTRWPPTARPATSRRSRAERVGGTAGRMGRLSGSTTSTDELVARSQPARRRPAQHQLRRRQHLGQGHRRPTR